MVLWLVGCVVPRASHPDAARDPRTPTDPATDPQEVGPAPVEAADGVVPRPGLVPGDACARAFFGVDAEGALAPVVDPTSGASLPPVVVVALSPEGPGTACVVTLDVDDAVVGGDWLPGAELWFGFVVPDAPNVRSEAGCEPWRAAGRDPLALVDALGLSFGVGPAGTELGGHVGAVTDGADDDPADAVAYAWVVDPATMTLELSSAGDYGYLYRQPMALGDVPAEGGVNPGAYEVIGLRALPLR